MGKHRGCGILLEIMPEQETKRKHSMLSVLVLFALLVLILTGQSFYAVATKNHQEPEFNYAPAYKQGSPELEISALSYLGAYLGEDNDPMILAEKTRKIYCQWPASPS